MFTRFARVVEPSGSNMTVRTALGIINQVLDEVLAEQEGEFDADTRWALAWFEQFGTKEDAFGTAEVLSVISSSPGELGPVFEAILANAVRICDASFGNLLLSEGSALRVGAMHGAPLAWDELRRRDPVIHFGPKSPLARMAASRHLEHIADARMEEAYLERDLRA